MLKYCIYCASAPSLHRESTDSLIDEIPEVNRSDFEMESVRSARKLFLADWSRSELSSEEILEENMLEISSSVTLQPDNLLLQRLCQTRFQKSLLRELQQAPASGVDKPGPFRA